MRKCSKIARKKSWGSFWLNVWTLSLLKKYSIYRVSSIHLLWSPLKRRLGCLLICLRRPHLGRFEERVRFRHHSRYYLGGWQFSRWYRCSCYSYILLQENGTHALLCKFLRRHSFRFCLFLSHIPNNHEFWVLVNWKLYFSRGRAFIQLGAPFWDENSSEIPSRSDWMFFTATLTLSWRFFSPFNKRSER